MNEPRTPRAPHRRRRRAPIVGARVGMTVMLIVSACAGDGSSGPAVTDAGSAVIVTTTLVADEPTVDEPTVDIPTDEPTVDVTTATEPTGATGDGTAPIATPPDVGGPVVGDPVVGTELIGVFEQPVDLAVRAGDDALYLVEQPGRVVRWEGSSTVVADISERVTGGNEQGLLGLEFSADGTLAYLDYTDRNGETTVAEYPVAPDGTIDVDSERILLVVDQPFRNHNAGDLAFGPDGMLYVTLGDGGSADDPGRRASDPATLLGSLLRIDPTPSGDRPYSIPADNPFATGTLDGIAGAPEVWAWGLRNPWKIAFDPVTGALWIADVGQNEFEEVNVVTPTDGAPAGRGVDFGWSAYEGTERFNRDVDDTGRTTFPVLTYRHGDDGCSVSGGVPYRGAAIAGLEPAYVYGDYCSGTIWALDLAGGRNLTLLSGFNEVTAVRAGSDGELYVLQRGGRVARIVPG